MVASGDLTHRGLRSQHERAGGVPARARPAARRDPRQPRHPVHIPEALHAARGTEFERLWETTEPVYRVGDAHRRRAQLRPALAAPVRRRSGEHQLQHAAEVFSGVAGRRAAESSTLHHHLLGAPWRSRKKPVAKRNRVLAGLVEAGADLDPRRAHPPEHDRRAARVRDLDPGGEHAVVVSIAPGLRPAAAEPARRGARAARLRGRRRTRCGS